MYIIYCDGSAKENGNIVVSAVVAKLSPQYQSITEILYCYKQTYEKAVVQRNQHKDNAHELIAYLQSLSIIQEMQLENEQCVIVNDSIADTLLMNEFKKEILDKKDNLQYQYSSEKYQNPVVKNLLEKALNISLNFNNFYFQQLPRTTLGINIADFLNKEEHCWLNEQDKVYCKPQLKKLKHRTWNYNISSKNDNKINEFPIQINFIVVKNKI